MKIVTPQHTLLKCSPNTGPLKHYTDFVLCARGPLRTLSSVSLFARPFYPREKSKSQKGDSGKKRT